MYPSIFNRFLVTSLCLLTPFLMWSQQANVNLDWNPQKNTENLTPFSAPLNSPEVQDDGRVNFIMDNLLAEGKAVPMIIAIPNNQVVHRNHPRHAELTFDLFARELREHVVPLVDANYSTRPNPRGRALSGLSMGGRHTMIVGFNALDLFGSFGVLSAGDTNAGETLSDFFNDPDVNKKIDYLFVGQGRLEAEGRFNARVQGLVDALNAHDVEHEYYVGGHTAHDWATWRHLLHERFLPNLWRKE
jgi:enterochelin esterase family protein